ncbi:MAG: GGDEF domain-containing protein [Acidimicrobiia bacterium]|nr:GGDEF domain-containing protein [Acidimicrobiia bacterium]
MESDARETAGTTICLIVRYVRAHAGEDGVARLLELAGETRPVAELEDEHRWTTYEQKIALFDAACVVLDDPDAVLHIGEHALDHRVGPGIRVLLRALGSPRTVIANVAKACPKFSTVATMHAEIVDRHHALVTYQLDADKVPHRSDCQLNIGLMRTIGPIFGLDPLGVTHLECQVEGAPACRYEVSWPKRRHLLRRRSQTRALENQVDALSDQLRLLQSTTADLVSSDDVDQVLQRIVSRAGRAVSATGYLLALTDQSVLARPVYTDGIPEADHDRVAAEVIAAPIGRDRHRLVIEVVSSQRVYGRLAAFSRGETFFDYEEHILTAYARSAAAALDVAIALDQAQRRGEATAALLGLARSLAEPISPARVARITASAIPEIVRVDAAAVLLWDPDTESLRVTGRTGWSREVGAAIDHLAFRADEAPALHQMLEAPSTRILRGTGTGPIAELVRRLGLPALVVAPIHARRGGFLGVAVASIAEANLRRADEIAERMAAVADQAATAIQNSLLHEQLQYQAVHDPLTGLANRALANDELDKATARAERDHHPLSVLFVDLDDFKSINDQFGHGAGDYALKVVAARLVDAARRGDSIARLGGDEFVMILPDATAEDAEVIAARVRTATAAPIGLGAVDIQIHASVGLAATPEDGTDPHTLLRAADVAMYRAKSAARLTLEVTPS